MFAFRLALALGYPHPRFLLRELTARDLAEWHAYYHIAAWGDDHIQEMLATLTALTWNRGRGKSEQPIDADELLPFRKVMPQQDPEEMKLALRRLL